MNSLAEVRNVVVAPVTPMDLIQRASQAGASIEQMQQLFELKLRVEADEARKAFKKALAAFKLEGVRVIKNVTIKDGPLKGKKHADLFGVCNAVIPVLAKYGMSHSWKLTKDDPAWMEIACTISHEDGYSESVTMGAAPDTGPGRNAIQARGSAVSYLERYTLMAALGLAAEDQDNDGNVSHSKPQGMPEHELVAALDAIANAAHITELHSIYAAHYKAAKALGDQDAMNRIADGKDKRKEELK